MKHSIVLSSLILLGLGLSPGCSNNAAVPTVEASRSAQLELNLGRQVSGPELQSKLPGSTLYGHYLDPQISWLEQYSDGGRYFAQFNEPVFDRYGSSRNNLSGTWEVRGNLLCYEYFQFGFDGGCVAVHELNGNLQFVDPTTRRVDAVTTEIEWAQASSEAAAKQSEPTTDVPSESFGTGFVVSKNGFVLTNSHVIEGCREIGVRVGGNSSPSVATVTARDDRADLAVLRLPFETQAAAILGGEPPARPGDDVIAIGFPLRGLLSDEPIVTTGTVSALAGIGGDQRLLQISAPVQPGNSGGPLFDQSGYVVGVIVGKLDAALVAEATGDIPQNVNFAIKVAVAKSFLSENGIQVEPRGATRKMTTSDIASSAIEILASIVCRK